MRYNKHIFIFFILTFGMFLLLTCCSEQKYVAMQPEPHKDMEYKWEMIYGNPDSIKVRKGLLLQQFSSLLTPDVEEMYRINGSRLLWFRDKKIISSADTILSLLSDAHSQGLQPYRYHYMPLLSHKAKTEALIDNEIYDKKQIVTLDVLLTSALYHYGHDNYYGLIRPREVDKGWEISPKELNLPQLLHDALQNEILSLTMKEFVPIDPQYELLKDALHELKEKADAYSAVPVLDSIVTYELNDTAAGIEFVRKKLEITGDLPTASAEKNKHIFDEDLQKAVNSFQERNGLEKDGVICRKTIAALNMTIDELMAKVVINLERLRWFAHKPDEEHIVVNLADYSLHYHRANEHEITMKAITGTKENYTPVLKDTLEYLVFNPEWRIPAKIVRDEMLSKMKQDTNYLSRNKFVIYDRFDGEEVDPESIDWVSINEDNFSYSVVQEAGRMNSLGMVKFIFPNHRSIYLHDTPARHLFSKNDRAFSHGCVRLEKPMELAARILSDQMEFPEMEIKEILDSEETTVVHLEHPIPVHFVYYTAWVDDKGVLNFRGDIYDFDKVQFQKMNLQRDPYIRMVYF